MKIFVNHKLIFDTSNKTLKPIAIQKDIYIYIL